MRTIQESTGEYAKFRKSYRLKKGTWREYNAQKGKTYACALGAFLHTDEEGENATLIGCQASMMPRWLVDLTPDFFDHDYKDKKFHLRWADALYLPGGLIDRANKLELEDRRKVYAAALNEIKRRLNCQLKAAGVTELGRYQHIENILSIPAAGRTWDERYVAMDGIDQAWFAVNPEKAAGTIIQVLDEKLQEAGA